MFELVPLQWNCGSQKETENIELNQNHRQRLDLISLQEKCCVDMYFRSKIFSETISIFYLAPVMVSFFFNNSSYINLGDYEHLTILNNILI